MTLPWHLRRTRFAVPRPGESDRPQRDRTSNPFSGRAPAHCANHFWIRFHCSQTGSSGPPVLYKELLRLTPSLDTVDLNRGLGATLRFGFVPARLTPYIQIANSHLGTHCLFQGRPPQERLFRSIARDNVILCTIALDLVLGGITEHARLLICASLGTSPRWPEKYISLFLEALPTAGPCGNQKIETETNLWLALDYVFVDEHNRHKRLKGKRALLDARKIE